jgi:hypothetical protein
LGVDSEELPGQYKVCDFYYMIVGDYSMLLLKLEERIYEKTYGLLTSNSVISKSQSSNKVAG